MNLAEQIELANAQSIIALAEKHMRYLRKEGEYAPLKWWEMLALPKLPRLPPMPVTAGMVRQAQAVIDKYKTAA